MAPTAQPAFSARSRARSSSQPALGDRVLGGDHQRVPQPVAPLPAVVFRLNRLILNQVRPVQDLMNVVQIAGLNDRSKSANRPSCEQLFIATETHHVQDPDDADPRRGRRKRRKTSPTATPCSSSTSRSAMPLPRPSGAKRALSIAIAQDESEGKRLEATLKRIADLEERATAALADGRDDLADRGGGSDRADGNRSRRHPGVAPRFRRRRRAAQDRGRQCRPSPGRARTRPAHRAGDGIRSDD